MIKFLEQVFCPKSNVQKVDGTLRRNINYTLINTLLLAIIAIAQVVK